MAYTKYHDEWENYPDSDTPVSAEALEHIESGIAAAAETADGAATAEHNHAAGDVTSGTFTVARIPDLAQSKINGLTAALGDLNDALDALTARVETLENE